MSSNVNQYMQHDNERKELGIVKTCPELADHIIHIITTFSSNQKPTVPPIDFKQYRLDLRQAHLSQKQIGFDLFLKGIVDKKWSKIQEKYIVNEKLGKKINIVRWNKKLTEILLLHCVTCCKERCTIIAAESQSAYEKNIQEKKQLNSIMIYEKIHGNYHRIVLTSSTVVSIFLNIATSIT